MSSNNIYQLNQTQPTLASNLDNKGLDIKSSLCCANPGIIQSFNPETQTADVQLVQVKQYYGEYYEPPLLINLPVLISGSPQNFISYPQLEGANCIVLTCDRDISSFLRTGSIAPPATNRLHNISDSIVLPFITTQNSPLKNYDTEYINIQRQNSAIKIKDRIVINAKDDIELISPTKITINAPSTNVTGNLNVGTGYTGVIPCGSVSISVTNGIITGVV